MNLSNRVSIIIPILISLTALHIHVSGQNRYVLNRLGGEIEFDGIGNESAWDSIAPLPMIMFNPVYGI